MSNRVWYRVGVELQRQGERYPILIPSGQTILLTEPEHTVLMATHGVGTLAELVDQAAAARSLRGIDQETLRVILSSLMDRQIFVSESEVHNVFKSTTSHSVEPRSSEAQSAGAHSAEAHSAERNKITTLVIPTCDRPLQLDRCLQSYQAELNRLGENQLRVLVIDDSRNPKSWDANRSIIEKYRRGPLGLKIHYLDRQQRMTLISDLSSQIPAEAGLVQFALLGSDPAAPTYGASRNTAQLLTLNELVISADDDTLCHFHVMKDFARANMFAMSGKPREWKTYWPKSFEELEAWASERWSGSFLAEYEKVLGQHPQKLLLNAISKKHFSGVARLSLNLDLQALLGDPGCRVSVVSPGVLGDSGSTNFFEVLVNRGPRLEALSSAESTYQFCMQNGKLATYPTCYEMAPFSMLQAYHHGLDNRMMLPPHFPMYRGEDDVWAIVMKRLATSVQGRIPLAVSHFPTEVRGQSLEQGIRDLCALKLPLLMMVAILGPAVENPTSSSPVKESPSQIAGRLRELARSTPSTFDQFAQEAYCRITRARLAGLSRTRQSLPPLPGYTLRDLDELLTSLEAQLKNTELIRVHEYASQGPRYYQSIQSDLQRFANLLELWPEIRAQAIHHRDWEKTLSY